MIEHKIDILSDVVLKIADAICFTSNGIIKANGELVMGAGIAKQFRQKFADTGNFFGYHVKNTGNHVYVYHRRNSQGLCDLVSFPTKNHWRGQSEINLIIQSANELVIKANELLWKKVYLPRPGCANGGLDWEQTVKPILQPLLDDRFIICSL